MKEKIHPDYRTATVVCGCGNTFETRSTISRIAVEICSNCHPFYTGRQKFVDTAGMIERFTKKWGTVEDREEKERAKTAKKEERKRNLPLGMALTSLPTSKPAAAESPAQPAPEKPNS